MTSLIESLKPKAKGSNRIHGPPDAPKPAQILPEADCSADLPAFNKPLSRRRGVQFSSFVGKMLSKLPEEQVEEPHVELDPPIPRLFRLCLAVDAAEPVEGFWHFCFCSIGRTAGDHHHGLPLALLRQWSSLQLSLSPADCSRI